MCYLHQYREIIFAAFELFKCVTTNCKRTYKSNARNDLLLLSIFITFLSALSAHQVLQLAVLSLQKKKSNIFLLPLFRHCIACIENENYEIFLSHQIFCVICYYCFAVRCVKKFLLLSNPLNTSN